MDGCNQKGTGLTTVMKTFRQWLEDSQSDAEAYFSIGHGDYSDEHGFEPDYVVWAFLNGTIKVSKVIKIDPEDGAEIGPGGTHGNLWGHHLTDRTYKGRYEPQTGRLSIVSPTGKMKGDIPDSLIRKLHQKFKNITQVYEF